MASYERDFNDDDELDTVDGPNDQCSSTSSLCRGISVEQTQVYMTTLESAIQGGNVELASEMAKLLANLHTSVCVETGNDLRMSSREDLISCTINVEDLNGPKHSVVWKLEPSISVYLLKWKLFYKFGYRPDVQQWVIGSKIVNDGDKLAECGVTSSGSVIFIYLLSLPSVNQTLPPESSIVNSVTSSLISEISNQPGSPSDNRLLLQRMPSTVSLASSTELLPDTQGALLSTAREQVGWRCPQCTLINEPTRPGCEACSFDRPVDYQLPAGYKLTERERRRLEEVHELDELMEHRSGSAWVQSESTHDVIDRPLTDEELANHLQQQELMLIDRSQSNSNRFVR